MHAICQLVKRGSKSSMIYVGKEEGLTAILAHQGDEINLFYTVADIKPEAFPDRIGTPWKPSVKDFTYTDYVAFDIDGIEPGQDVTDTEHVCEAWLAEWPPLGERHYIASGHGLHLLLRIPRQDSIDFFKYHHDRYKFICQVLQAALHKAGIRFKQVDPAIFEGSRLLRVPGTLNVKPGMEPVRCRWLESLGVEEAGKS